MVLYNQYQAFPNEMTEPSDPLDPLLNRWKDTPAPSPLLSSEVWRRIALSESEQTETTSWWDPIEAWFCRPSFAALFLASCVLLGLFLAELRVSHLQRERSTQLARSYMLLIDPLLANNDTSPHR
jgi:hypothetical protein